MGMKLLSVRKLGVMPVEGNLGGEGNGIVWWGVEKESIRDTEQMKNPVKKTFHKAKRGKPGEGKLQSKED